MVRLRASGELLDPAVPALSLRFRFFGELNDFLKREYRNLEFKHAAGLTDTVKHVIESLGVPHTEIGRVAANGETRAFSSLLADGDFIEVFPHATPIILQSARFVLDGHLGRLAAYLRMLGFDTWYERLAGDELLASVSAGEDRILLTRDVGLLKRREIRQAYCVRNDKPHQQLREVTTRFALQPQFAPFTRCMDCNAPLYGMQKEDVVELLPPHTRETKNEFSRCSSCGKIYWRGSHHSRMSGWIQSLTHA